MFVLGCGYTRREIQARLGGSVVACLPTHSGVIVAACLSKKFSPGAPEVVLCGKGVRTTPLSAAFSRQKAPIPVFLKIAANQWRYQGEFIVARSFSAGARFESLIIGSGRSVASVSYVVVLQPSEQVAATSIGMAGNP